MTAVTRTTIDSSAHENIFSVIDTRSYVKDPKHPNSNEKNRVFVYDADPLAKGINFGDFPYIVVEFPTIEMSKVSVDGKHKDVFWSHRITVRTIRDGSSNVGNSIGKSDMQSISDDLFETFNSEAVKIVLRGYNMHKMVLEKNRVETMAVDQRLIYEAQYTLSYTERLAVSA